MKKISGKSRGQVAVLYSAALAFALAGAVGLGADVAVMYINWQQLQKAADAAAISGAGYLPNNSSTGQTTATTIAENDGVLSTEIVAGTPSVSANGLSLTVSASRTVPYYFGQVLGMTSQSENVTATAGIQGNGAGGRGLMPLSLSCPGGSCSGTCGGYFAGTTYTMKQDQSQTSLSGNWGALALGGNGASVYQNNLEVGYTGTISSTVSSEPGNIVGPTSQGIADRVAAGVAADPTIAAGSAPSSASAALTTYAYDPRLIVVPMVDFSAKCAGSSKGGKNTDLPVVEYAQMWLLGTSGNNATISAVYLGTLTSPPSGSSAVANFGLMTPVLQN